MNKDRDASIRWRRGMIRVWIVLSLLWAGFVLLMELPGLHVAWPWVGPQIVHVKVSDTETWDYPAEWGVERITEDLKRRLAAEDEKDKEWAAALPAARRAECDSIPQNTPIEQQRKDCVKLFFLEAGAVSAVPTDWQSQVPGPRISIIEAAERTIPPALGPPLAVLLLGGAFGWALAGFRSDRNGKGD